MHWIIGNWPHFGVVVGKVVLMYGIALCGLRIGERRTLAQWRIIDFVAAVAMGAVVGRTAVASSQSFVTGAVALLALVGMHRVASILRLSRTIRPIFDHRIRVLVRDGVLRTGQLRRCGLNDDDVAAHLRQRGFASIEEVKYLIYEGSSQLTIVRRHTADTALIHAALHKAADFRP